ncbi:MAG TPA: DUF3153 domain-containing protein [Nostocaceae cyanobacterium]|nr:DUF3153 domain-containing protein [Nostocaceae cyanobacterium]
MPIFNWREILLWLMQPFKILLTKIEGINTTKPILLIICVISLLLSGCVQYNLGVNYNSTNSGELIQHIQLSDKLTSFSGDYIYEWLDSLERRARKLNGSVQRIAPAEVIVKIPFSNSQELQEKFHQFFNYRIDKKNEKLDETELPNIASNLLVDENNFLLLSRHKLTYDLDLRSLDVIAGKGNILTNTGSVVNLDFSLQTPWGAKNILTTDDAIKPEKKGNHLVWKLLPGKINHIEVVFWLPNFLGIGTLLIILFVWGGFYLKYNLLPNPTIQPKVTEG